MIELKNISFSYANNCEDSQLRHIDLTVKKGELIILAGKSGCGKTTLTRVLNGLCPQFYLGNLTGSYSLDGQDALKIPIQLLWSLRGSIRSGALPLAGADFYCDFLGLVASAIISTIHPIQNKPAVNVYRIPMPICLRIYLCNPNQPPNIVQSKIVLS